MNFCQRKYQKYKLALGIASAILLSASTTVSADTGKVDLNIKSQKIGSALVELGESTGVQILFKGGVDNQVQLSGITGNYTLNEALDKLLYNSGFVYQFTSDNTVVIKEGENSLSGDGKEKVPSGRGRELEEVIVTAQKREQSVMDVPISIAAMDGAELEERGIGNFEDLGLAVPGLSVEDNGNVRRIYLRGVGNSTGSSSTIGIYYDEVPISGGSPTFHYDVRPYDLERIEVLRGPQGTLYGQGSMGGTIRFVTKNPELDRFTSRMDFSTSYTEDGSPSASVQGVVNLPLIQDTLAVRIAATYDNDGGWIDQPALGKSDINDQSVKEIRVKTLWQPTEDFSANLMVAIHRNDRGAPGQGEDENHNYTQLFNQMTTPSIQNDYDIYSLTLTYDMESVSLLSTTSYSEGSKLALDIGNSCCGGYQILYPSTDDRQNIFSQEIRLGSLNDGPWQWSTGVFYHDAEVSTAGSYYFALGDLPAIAPYPLVSETAYHSWAVFGNTSYEVTDRLELGAGLRYFEEDREFVDATGIQSDTFDSVNPRLYANFDVSDVVMMYVSAAKGFRSGGFNYQGAPTYAPETLWSYELGSKMSFDAVDLEFALFYSDYTDFTVYGDEIINGVPISIFSNAGNARIIGLDWDVNWRTTDNLSLSFKGNYVDSVYTEIRVTGTPREVGERLDQIPIYKFTVSANYDFNWRGRPGFARLDYNQQGQSVADGDMLNRSDVINMLNFHVGGEWTDKLSVGLFARNLLNEDGYLSPNGACCRFTSRPRPRTVGVEVGFNFN